MYGGQGRGGFEAMRCAIGFMGGHECVGAGGDESDQFGAARA